MNGGGRGADEASAPAGLEAAVRDDPREGVRHPPDPRLRAPGRVEPLAASLFSELLMIEQLAKSLLGRVLPRGMELSHFAVLNHLGHLNDERTPAQLARAFHVTRGAMTNTLSKLEWAGHVHIRPDWDDARRKFVSISPAGRQARDDAIAALSPVMVSAVTAIGADRARTALPILRDLRALLEEEGEARG